MERSESARWGLHSPGTTAAYLYLHPPPAEKGGEKKVKVVERAFKYGDFGPGPFLNLLQETANEPPKAPPGTYVGWWKIEIGGEKGIGMEGQRGRRMISYLGKGKDEGCRWDGVMFDWKGEVWPPHLNVRREGWGVGLDVERDRDGDGEVVMGWEDMSESGRREFERVRERERVEGRDVVGRDFQRGA